MRGICARFYQSRITLQGSVSSVVCAEQKPKESSRFNYRAQYGGHRHTRPFPASLEVNQNYRSATNFGQTRRRSVTPGLFLACFRSAAVQLVYASHHHTPPYNLPP